MASVRIALIIDEDVLRAVRVRAARRGVGASSVVEQALHRDLGFDLLERIWAKAKDDLSEEEAMRLAVEAQYQARSS